MSRKQIILWCILSAGPAFSQLSWEGCANTKDGDFKKTTVLSTQEDSAFIEPLRLDIDGTGRLFVALKRSGQVWMLEPAADYRKTVLGRVPVTPLSYHGLLGMALAPDFLQSGFIYLLTTHQAAAADPILFRVSRITLAGNALVPASQKTILEWPTEIKEGHTGGDLAFGPGGILHITTGNDTWARPTQFSHPNSTYKMTGSDDYRTPIDEREPHFNSLRSSANTNDLRGKVLRIKPIPVPASHPQHSWGLNTTYTVPAGNLFPVGKAKTRPEIFAMGLRNPYSIHVEADGGVFLADVGPQGTTDILTGPSGGDQLYITRKAANFGFPMFVDGSRPYPIFDFAQEKVTGVFDAKAPVNYSRFNTGLDTLPPTTAAVAVSHHRNALNMPGWFTSGAMSLIAGPIYRYDGKNASGAKFPPHFDGKWIIAEEAQNLIKAVTLDGDKVVKVQNIFTSMKFYNPLDLKFAPDGSLYVLEYSGWNSSNAFTKISRIAYAGACAPAVGIERAPSRRLTRRSEFIPEGARTLALPPQAKRIEIFTLGGKRIHAQELDGNRTTLRLPSLGRKGLLLAKYGY